MIFGIKNYMCVESQSGIVGTIVNSAFVRLKQEDRHGFLGKPRPHSEYQDSVGFKERDPVSKYP